MENSIYTWHTNTNKRISKSYKFLIISCIRDMYLNGEKLPIGKTEYENCVRLCVSVQRNRRNKKMYKTLINITCWKQEIVFGFSHFFFFCSFCQHFVVQLIILYTLCIKYIIKFWIKLHLYTTVDTFSIVNRTNVWY